MKTTPDTPGSLCGALYGSFKLLDLRAGGVEEELDFFLDGGYFEAVEGDDFVAVVYCGSFSWDAWITDLVQSDTE